MQKSFIVIVLALTLTSTFAAYTASNYATAPVSVAADSDTNFTNQSSLSLASITSGNVYLVSGNKTLNPQNVSANNWNLFYRQLNTTTLAGTQNNTASIVAPLNVFFYLNNYAVGFDTDNTTGAPNLWAYQAPLTGGTTAPGRLQLSNNTNVNFTVTFVSVTAIGNTVYLAYLAANLTVNITSFTVGATAPGTSFTVSTTFDTPYSWSLVWGEALGSSQLFAVWVESGVLKDAVIDVSKGIVATPTVVPGYNKSSQNCFAFATDGKFYGEYCYGLDTTSGNALYWVRTTANGTLIQIATYPYNTSSLAGLIPYGPYLAVFFRNTTAATGVNYAYELWNLDTFNTTSVQPRTQYLNIDSNSTQVPFRVVSGGIYTLLYNNRQANGTLTNVQVGLLLANPNPAPTPAPTPAPNNGSSNNTKPLGSSYLASVLGFLLTIVAGLLFL